MPRKQTARNANGAGTIRKITTTKNGKTYTYWQARYTSGYDPGTGKQIQRSITGKTKSEVAQKLRSITTGLDCGTYCSQQADPRRMVGYLGKLLFAQCEAPHPPYLSIRYSTSYQALFGYCPVGLTDRPYHTGVLSKVDVTLQSTSQRTVSKDHQKCPRCAAQGSQTSRAGRPDARFHDLRHSFAVASIRAGDDIKSVQGNLGHATAAFTLDVYGHVTMQMKKESAARMEAYIKSVSSL